MNARPLLLGLTGSIGMGKSTTAGFFADAEIPVWDADAAVHRIYGPDGAGADALRDIAPDAVKGGIVDRDTLRAAVAADPALLSRVEARVHPLVAADRAAFIAEHDYADILVFDIPILFETGADAWLDAVLVVTAPAETQRARVMARPGMTGAVLERLLERQMPDAEKRARADHVIETDKGVEAARADVLSLIDRIRAGRRDA